jgi:disulfide bond formation protein DsbB
MTINPTHLAGDPRFLSWLLLALSGSAVATSLFVQHALGVDPCSLCVIQRLTYLACTLAAGSAIALGGSRQARIGFTALVVALAAGGLSVAAYQTWLQAFPPAHASCSAGFGMLLDDTPFEGIWHYVMDAPGDCREITLRIAGLSMAQASVLLFGVLGSIGILRLRTERATHRIAA